MSRIGRQIGRWITSLRDTEPARWAELARVLLMITVGLGWVTVDEETINWIVTGVGMIASALLTRWVRSSVYSQHTVNRLLTRRTPRPAPRRPLRLHDDPAADQPQDPPTAPHPA